MYLIIHWEGFGGYPEMANLIQEVIRRVVKESGGLGNYR
jgi:hypothetical protein